MSNLTFVYGAMSSSKSAMLLTEAHNLRQHGWRVFLLTAAMDTRSGQGVIKSRLGISSPAETWEREENLFEKVRREHEQEPISRVMVDEAQWLTKAQVWQLSDVADALGIPVTCYGLRSDFRGDLFEGSAALMAIADEMKENTGVCPSGAKATMVARYDASGTATLEGPQVLVGGEESYASMSRKAWKAAIAEGATARQSAAA